MIVENQVYKCHFLLSQQGPQQIHGQMTQQQQQQQQQGQMMQQGQQNPAGGMMAQPPPQGGQQQQVGFSDNYHIYRIS